MKFTTKSTINKKYIRIMDLIAEDYVIPAKELDVNASHTWSVKPNTGVGKITIETSPDGDEKKYKPYLIAQHVDEGDCIEVDNQDHVTKAKKCDNSEDEDKSAAAE
jgi:hypothetical protein